MNIDTPNKRSSYGPALINGPIDVLFPTSACFICCIFCSFFKMLPVQQHLVEMALPVQITGKIINAHAHLAIQGNCVKFEVSNHLF